LVTVHAQIHSLSTPVAANSLPQEPAMAFAHHDANDITTTINNINEMQNQP